MGLHEVLIPADVTWHDNWSIIMFYILTWLLRTPARCYHSAWKKLGNNSCSTFSFVMNCAIFRSKEVHSEISLAKLPRAEREGDQALVSIDTKFVLERGINCGRCIAGRRLIWPFRIYSVFVDSLVLTDYPYPIAVAYRSAWEWGLGGRTRLA